MLEEAGQKALNDEQMRAFDLLWCDPSLSAFGFDDYEALHHFSDKIVHDQAFKAEKQQELMQLYNSHDSEEMGILQEAAALAFIKEAIQKLHDG